MRWVWGLCWVFMATLLACARTPTPPRSPEPAAPPPPLGQAAVLPVFDAQAQVEGRPSALEATPLRVLDRQPVGLSRGEDIRLRFDRPVAAPDALPRASLVVERESAEGTWVEVRGETTWARADRLVFEPQESLPRAHRYRVRLQGSVDGIEDVRWSFESPRPVIAPLYDAEDVKGREAVTLEVDVPGADPRDLARHLTVRDHDGNAVAVRVRKAAVDRWVDLDVVTRLDVVPVRPWPRRGPLSFEVAESYRTAGGRLPLLEVQRWSVTTLPRFTLKRRVCEGGSKGVCPLGPVDLVFSQEPETLEGVTMVPEPEGFEVHWNGEHTVQLSGGFVPGRRYEIVLPADYRDEQDQRIVGRRRVGVRFSHERGEGEGSLSLARSVGIFATAAQARIGVRTQRVSELEVRIAVLDAEAGAAYVGADRPSLPEGVAQSVLFVRPQATVWGAEVSTLVDLSRWAGQGDTVLVEVRASELDAKTRGEVKPVRGVFRISSLGVWAHQSPARGMARITQLDSGAPRGGVRVSLRGEDGTTTPLGTTNAHGEVALPGAQEVSAGAVLIAQGPGDALALPLRGYDWGRRRTSCRTMSSGRCRWIRRGWGTGQTEAADPVPPLEPGEHPLVALAVGRGVYLPGDTVHVAGWASISTPYGSHNSRRLPVGTEVALALHEDRREPALAHGTATVDAHGRFVATLRVPPGAKLGRFLARATVLESDAWTWFVVAQPRLPAFEVQAEPVHASVLRGEPLRVDVQARYLSGEEAPMRSLEWALRCFSSTPELPELAEGFSVWNRSTDVYASGSTMLGKASTTLALTPEGLDHRSGRQCEVSISALDARAQPVGADTAVWVHPGPGYLAIALPDQVFAGQRLVVRGRVVDLQGRPREAERVVARVAREIDGDGTTRPVHACRVAASSLRCQTRPLSEGRVHVSLSAVVDGQPLEVQRSLWVRPKPTPAPKRTVVREAPTRPPERPFEVSMPENVEAGVPVAVHITAPWSEGAGTVLVSQTGLRETVPFELKGGEARVSVTPRAGAGPTLEVMATLARPEEGLTMPRVMQAQAQAWVRDRGALVVSITAPRRMEPRQRGTVTVTVHDDAGEPVDARVALWVVDDALHQLRRPWQPDLAQVFNPARPFEGMVSDGHRSLLRPFDGLWGGRTHRVPRVRSARAAVKGGMDVSARQKFVPVPVFVGNVGTGPDGVVEVPLALADDLTRFDVRAVASAPLPDGDGAPARFGYGNAKIEVSTPLPVRTAMPRVLRPGDAAEIAAVITVPVAGRLRVEAEADGSSLVLHGSPSESRRVRAGEVVRVPFQVHTRAIGEASVTFTASLERDEGTAVQGGVVRPLPVVEEPTALERAAVYGSTDQAQPLAMPLVLPRARRGTVEVAVTSTALGDLQDAADYLLDYPYGCVEQTSSRLVPLVALRGLGERVPDASERVAAALEHLASMQLDDGRFAYWPGSTAASGFGTAYAAWVLTLARDAGVSLPPEMLPRTVHALAKDLERTETPDEREALQRVLAARVVVEDRALEAPTRDRLWNSRSQLPVFGRLLLLQTLHRADPDDPRVATLLEALSASIEVRPGVARVVDPDDVGGRWWYAFSSSARTEALTLLTLLQVAPDDPRIEKLARGLRSRRRAGRWRTTQENAFALLALAGYAQRAEAVTPDHRVQVWLGRERVLDARQEGFEQTRQVGRTSLRSLSATEAPHVVVHREGQGRAYFRVGMTWTPEDAPPRAQGIGLERTLPERVSLGERARMELRITAEAPVRFVAVEVPLPAGLEAVDTSLGAGAYARALGAMGRSPFLSHLELRPDRVVLFFDSLPAGTFEHRVPLIATSPGTFSVPAAVAEAMYEPETRARTAPSTVTVER